MSNYKFYTNNEKYIRHAAAAQSNSGGSKSKYKGGFVVTNNRLNNSKEYNHDYYLKNKDKWNKNSTNGVSMNSLFLVPTSLIPNILSKGLEIVSNLLSRNNSYIVYPDKKKPKWTPEKEPELTAKEKALRTTNRVHKYLYKVTSIISGKTRYFYTTAQYYAYLKNLKRKEKSYTVQEDIDAVNPGYNTDRGNNDQNCAYCTLAYDLRRRGYDVTALHEYDSTFKGPTNKDIESWYEGGKFTTYRANVGTTVSPGEESEKLFKELASQGEGASGFLTCTWRGGESGHAMAYQVINGEAYVIDTQVGRVMNAEEFGRSYGRELIWGLSDPDLDKREIYRDYHVNYMRTDNIDPSRKVATIVNNSDGKVHHYSDDTSLVDKVTLVEDNYLEDFSDESSNSRRSKIHDTKNVR